ncbi:MAG: FecR domain-containing protein [Novosphingobium sp.]
MKLGRTAWRIFSLTICAVLAMMPGVASAEPPVTYVVAKGDTLIALARKYMVNQGSYRQVQTFNHLASPLRIPVGFTLRIPRELLRFEPIAVHVASFSGPASVAPSMMQGGAAVPLQKGMAIGEGAQVQTGANGFVALTAADGSRVALPSNSRIELVHARRYLLINAADIDFRIIQGRAEIQAARQKPQDQFRIRTPVAVSAVRGTEFRIGINPDASIGTTEVLEGKVAVASPKAEIAVPAGFGAAARASGEIASEALMPPPVLLSPGKLQTEAVVHFDFAPGTAAVRYHSQVSRDAAFDEVLAESESALPQGEFTDLPNGRFFLRSTAIAASGLEGMPDIHSFRRMRVGLAAEAEQSSIPGAVRINWRADGEGTSVFRFQLLGAGAGDLPLIDEPGLTTPGITLTGLKRGTYRWRIGVVQSSPDSTGEAPAEVWCRCARSQSATRQGIWRGQDSLRNGFSYWRWRWGLPPGRH